MTTPKNRGIVVTNQLPRKLKCRRCFERFENFDQLRFHAQTEHQRVTYLINRQLATIDAKLRKLQELADEGMIGHSDVPPGGNPTEHIFEAMMSS